VACVAKIELVLLVHLVDVGGCKYGSFSVLVALASDQAAIFWHPFVPVSLPLSLPASQQMRTPVMSTKAGGVAKS
jgi:hypothetical protein